LSRDLLLLKLTMKLTLKNQIYEGSSGRKSLVDLSIPENFNNKLIVFIHGYMGYKDWGCWNLVEDYFISKNFGFCKYNVSHNGGTIEDPIDFPDLDAFAKNTYSKEVFDLKAVLNWLETHFENLPEIYLVGHSRGGGIALLLSSDPRIKKITTWAAIDSIQTRFPEGKQLEVWKTQGTRYTVNSRTNQKMPHLFLQYEDYVEHADELNIEIACRSSKTPTLVIHGDADTSVNIEEGRHIAEWVKTRLFEIEEANHTFGSSQPWNEPYLPEHLEKVCELTLGFFEL
jgi:uncharacterized protein